MIDIMHVFNRLSGIHQMCIPGVTIIFSFLHPAGNAGGSQIPVFHGICDPRCQGIAVKYYGFTLGALALTTSGFCNAGVNGCPAGLIVC